MRVYGVDFTSAPGRSKPITVAECGVSEDRLRLLRPVLRVGSFQAFEECLAVPGPWIAGFDFPFGQPRRLVQDLGWASAWPDYVGGLREISRPQFGDLIEMYKGSFAKGTKEKKRRCDVAARSLPPTKTVNPPLAYMFFEGAPRLLKAGVSVVPCRPLEGEDRIAVEAYPALVARYLGQSSYKGTGRRNTPERREARRRMVAALGSDRVASRYGFRLELPKGFAEALLADSHGDLLDAVLAAVQAAWAWGRRDQGFGVPPDADPAEGWIVDPATSGSPP